MEIPPPPSYAHLSFRSCRQSVTTWHVPMTSYGDCILPFSRVLTFSCVLVDSYSLYLVNFLPCALILIELHYGMPQILLPWAKERGMTEDLRQLCREPAVVAAVMKSMQEEGRVAQLRGFENVQVR